jgi:hypothetical protein
MEASPEFPIHFLKIYTLFRSCLEQIPATLPHIPIQLRGNTVSIAEIFHRSGSALGWERLAHFTAQVADLQGIPAVRVDRNWLTGINNRITAVLKVENPADLTHRHAALTDAWFEDLKTIGSPVVIALDTYEHATTEIQEWISGPFLARVAQSNPVRVLIAGQIVPDENNIEWGHCCSTIPLYGVPEAEHWLPVVAAMGRRIPFSDPLTWLAGVCYALQGDPKGIKQVIEGLPR